MSDWTWPGEAAYKNRSRYESNLLREITKAYNGAGDNDDIIDLEDSLPNPEQRVNYYAD